MSVQTLRERAMKTSAEVLYPDATSLTDRLEQHQEHVRNDHALRAERERARRTANCRNLPLLVFGMVVNAGVAYGAFVLLSSITGAANLPAQVTVCGFLVFAWMLKSRFHEHRERSVA